MTEDAAGVDLPADVRRTTGRIRVGAVLALLYAALIVAYVARDATAIGSSAADGDVRSGAVVLTATGETGGAAGMRTIASVITGRRPKLHISLGELAAPGTPGDPGWCDAEAALGNGTPLVLTVGGDEATVTPDVSAATARCAPVPDGAVGTVPARYRLDLDGLVRVVVISPNVPIAGAPQDFRAGGEGSAWLAGQVSEARSQGIPWIVVALPAPCLNAGALPCAYGEDLLNLLVAQRVDVVLQGGEHGYQRTGPIATGPGCLWVRVDAIQAACAPRAGAVRGSEQGAGTIFVTAGAVSTLDDVVESDPGAKAMAAVMGANRQPTRGIVSLRVTGKDVTVEFVPVPGTGDFEDRAVVTSVGRE